MRNDIIHRYIRDGLIKAFNENAVVNHIVLTSPVNNVNSLYDDFKLFIDKINLECDSNFGYFAIFTNEGNGVVHLVTKNCFLSKDILSNYWSKIRHSIYVRKKFVDSKDYRIKLTNYMISHSYALDVDCSKNWLCDENDIVFGFNSNDGLNKKLENWF